MRINIFSTIAMVAVWAVIAKPAMAKSYDGEYSRVSAGEARSGNGWIISINDYRPSLGNAYRLWSSLSKADIQTFSTGAEQRAIKTDSVSISCTHGSGADYCTIQVQPTKDGKVSFATGDFAFNVTGQDAQTVLSKLTAGVEAPAIRLAGNRVVLMKVNKEGRFVVFVSAGLMW